MNGGRRIKIINVVGARPNFVKIAALMDAYGMHPGIEPVLVHTGQHYDGRMSDSFFRQLAIPEPDINLGIGSATHAVQTARIMEAFERIVAAQRPDAVLVVGDVNSTIACGLVAAKSGVKLVHVEAGLRSFDRSMPEEINRLLTDAISDLLFCTEQSGVDNLLREGVAREKIFLVGNVMIDTLLKHRQKAEESDVLEKLSVEKNGYALLTLHRPSNVDDMKVFGRILDSLEVIQRDMPVLFPIHPRTRRNLDASEVGKRVRNLPGLRVLEPFGYLDFLKIMMSSRFVMTDSGGIQEESTFCNIPCLTLRENTERPITAAIGTNRLVGTDTEKILAAYRTVVSGRWQKPVTPPYWDGRAAERIADILQRELALAVI